MRDRDGGEKGAPGESALTVPGVHIMSTPRSRLMATLRQAATLEREGCFDDAALYWQAGGELAILAGERAWCEARALLCQKRSQRPGG